VSNGLVALGSASVLAIYALGFSRTKAASERFAEDATPRRRPAPVPSEAPAPTTSLPPLAETAAPVKAAQPAAPEPPAAPGTHVAASPGLAREQPGVAAPAAIAAAPAPANARTSAAIPESPASTAAVATPPAATTPSVTASAAPALETPVAPAAATTATPAPAALAAAATATVAAPAKVILKDGSYTGWGTCRHGDIQATVVIAAGRIQSATISQCWTRYPCSWISPLPPQVVQRQSAEVDYVTGATQSTNAFYDAVMDALAKAK
jgi:uncharacterized protein with FMN-binding domain